MAVTKCPECGGAVSTTVDKCIHCGAEFKVCPECQIAVTGDTDFCPACGARLQKMGFEEVHADNSASKIDSADPAMSGKTVSFKEYLADWRQTSFGGIVSFILDRVCMILPVILIILIPVGLFVFLMGFGLLLPMLEGERLNFEIMSGIINYIVPIALLSLLITKFSSIGFYISDIIAFFSVRKWREQNKEDMLCVIKSALNENFTSMNKYKRNYHTRTLYHLAFAYCYDSMPSAKKKQYIFETVSFVFELIFLVGLCVFIFASSFLVNLVISFGTVLGLAAETLSEINATTNMFMNMITLVVGFVCVFIMMAIDQSAFVKRYLDLEYEVVKEMYRKLTHDLADEHLIDEYSKRLYVRYPANQQKISGLTISRR